MIVASSVMGDAVVADELKIDVIRHGNGEVAGHGQCATVHYEGRLTDETIFDASRSRVNLLALSLV